MTRLSDISPLVWGALPFAVAILAVLVWACWRHLRGGCDGVDVMGDGGRRLD
jgi:hypothetical protein